ncbi:MAG: spore coat associated protein CotJA [Clostridia bacterium]|nr:spore coat associated protein CotJA [Clostridia bacterium]
MEDSKNYSHCPITGCGCVGYAYVPIQLLNEVYSVDDALMNGTVFPELNLSIEEYGYVCKGTGGDVNG